MRRATCSSWLMRSRSRSSCSRRWPISSEMLVHPTPRRSYPGYAVDDDSFVAHLPAGRCYAHDLLSIVGSAQGVAAHHLVCFCYLVLNEAPAVGKGGSNLGDRPLQAFASGLLAGK